MTRAALPLLLAFAIAGCDGADAPSDAAFMEAGVWETEASIERIEMPGLSREQAEQLIARQKDQGGTQRSCHPGKTADERPKVGAPFDVGAIGECSFTEVADTGERVNRVVSCKTAEGSATQTITGRQDARSYELQVETRREAVPGSLIVTREKGQWLGPCEEEAGQ